MDLVIAVGGGGQHVALAIARLIRLGALDASTETVILDADTDSRLAMRLRTFGNTVTPATPHPLRGAESVVPAFSRDTMPDTRFRKLFLDASSEPLERELFELFYDEASGGNDDLIAGVDIARGMHGNPSVGSAVFAAGAEGVLEPLFARVHVATRVFIVGSFLGGTGAGIIHQLVALVRKSIDRKPIGLFGSFLLRWFDLPSARGDTVDNATLLASMGHGLEYFFAHTRTMLDASLVVGVPDHPGLPWLRAASAPPDNDETLSVYPLFASYALEMLPRKTDVQSRTAHAVYGVALDEGDPYAVLAADWHADVAPSRDASLGARVMESMVIEQCVASFRARATHFVEADFRDGARTLGALLATCARARSESAAAYGAMVLAALEARAAQLRFASTWIVSAHGGAIDLAELGDAGVRERYMRIRARKWTHPDAFDALVRAFEYMPPGLVDAAPSDVASWIERALRTLMRR